MGIDMNNLRKNELLAKAIKSTAFNVVGTLTIPRTYGVYRLGSKTKSVRRFRFGNHPIRQRELINEHGAADIIAVFFDRRHAEELASIENAMSK
jgi:hypothetical protein